MLLTMRKIPLGWRPQARAFVRAILSLALLGPLTWSGTQATAKTPPKAAPTVSQERRPLTNADLFEACITHGGSGTGAAVDQPWRAEAKRLRANLQKSSGEETHRTLVVNRSLRALAAAAGPQCWLASRDDQTYWAWQSSFSDDLEVGRIPQIGAFFDRRGARWFVSQVFAGSPAADAGIMEGDEVRTADGSPFHPIQSFQTKERGQTVWLELKRRATEKPISVPIKITVASFQEMLLEHMRRGHRLLKIDNRPVAYIPLPAASHGAFGETLMELLAHYQPLSQALILDVRGGIDGPDRTFYEPFLGDHPLYTRPIVLLQDGATSGGRERLAYLLQKTRRALVVGGDSKGAALVTDLIDLVPGEYALLVAPTQPGPKSAEGRRPVVPQRSVERQGLYGAGADAPLTKALETARNLIKVDPSAVDGKGL